MHFVGLHQIIFSSTRVTVISEQCSIQANGLVVRGVMVRFFVWSANLWVHLAFISIDTRNSLSGAKWPEREADLSFPFKLEVNVWSYISKPYVTSCGAQRYT